MSARSIAAGFVAIFVITVAPTAMAQSKSSFCRAYASESVDMQARNLDNNCGYQGLRWHTWYDGHYGWCMDWVNAQTVDEERTLRRIQIGRCTGEDRGRRANRSERD